MAENISEVGIVDGDIVFADHVLQLTDALKGDEAYNLHLSGNVQINSVFYPQADGATSGSVLMTDGAGVTGYGEVKSVPTASYAISASHSEFADTLLGSIDSASYAETASYAFFSEVARTSLDSINSTYTSSFTVSSLNYTFNHNLGFKYVIVQAYNTADQQIIPQEVTAIDGNNTFVRFSNPQNGVIVIQK